MKICLFLLFLIPLFLHAQYLPDLGIPKFKPSDYERLQTKTIVHTTLDFQLKGPVKSVCETIRTLKANGEDSSAHLKAEYLFSEKGKLLSYSEDSMSNLLKISDAASEILNTYDPTGEILLETIRQTRSWQKTKTVIRFNHQGFREEEIYTCYKCEQGLNRNDPFYDSIFDYTLDYQWSPDFDSVSFTYRYVKPKSPYQRERDMVRSFVYELSSKKKDQLKEEMSYSKNLSPGNNYFKSFENRIKYDKQGRIIEWTIWDHQIKNSFNVHSRTEYTYNEKSELTEIRYYSTGWSNPEINFQLELTEEIRYVSYDVYGNWTEMEVKVQPEWQRRLYGLKNFNFRYKREISYY